VDRLIQQAICQVLTPIFEKQFSDNSFGFRPKRSAHDALKRCQVNITEGYKYVVDMDLEKYFDTVNQSKLIQECDHELERRGHRFDRYADDLMIFCRSRKAAERTLEHIVPYIEKKLFLKVNREKTQVAYISRVKYLGYGFYVYKGEGKLKVHPESIRKLKDKIREITGRSNGMGIAERRTRLNQVIRGWVNYFKLADMKNLLKELDEWTRSRIRMVTWKRFCAHMAARGLSLVKLWEV